MKKLRLHMAVLALLIAVCVTMLQAGTMLLRPTGSTAVRSSISEPVNSGALQFDLSRIPKGAHIDLAELHLSVDVDTSLGKAVSVFVGVATEIWTKGPESHQAIETSDSLFASAMVESGLNKSVEIDLTELVALWHAGKIENQGIVLSVPGNSEKEFKLLGNSGNIDVTLEVFYTNQTVILDSSEGHKAVRRLLRVQQASFHDNPATTALRCLATAGNGPFSIHAPVKGAR